jgi:hypothetical protein
MRGCKSTRDPGTEHRDTYIAVNPDVISGRIYQ